MRCPIVVSSGNEDKRMIGAIQGEGQSFDLFRLEEILRGIGNINHMYRLPNKLDVRGLCSEFSYSLSASPEQIDFEVSALDQDADQIQVYRAVWEYANEECSITSALRK